MKIVYTLLILFILQSCSKEVRRGIRATNKIAKLKEWGYLKEKTDTFWQKIFIPADTIEIPLAAQVDTVYIDSVLEVMNDTCIPKKAVKDLARKIPCKTNPINYEDSLCKVTVIDGKLKVIHKEQIRKVPLLVHTTTVTNPDKHSHIWFWLGLIALSVVVLGLVFKGK